MLAQPKRFAILGHLAARPDAFCQRDTLLALFWPDLDETHARWALSQSLRFLRKELGRASRPVFVARNYGEIGLNPAAIWSDVAAFRSHVSADRHGEALDLYRGDLLDGFVADAGPEFEVWLSRERQQLRASAAQAARAVAESCEREQTYTRAVAAARRAVDLAAVDERVLRELLELLDRLGDRAGAVRAYDDFARRLGAEYDAEPAAETRALIARIRSRMETQLLVDHVPPHRNGERAEASVSPTPPVTSPAITPPAEVDGWRIVRELGRGGMSTVYLARDSKHGRSVALKLLRPELASSLATECFLREIQITANLAHPHILPLIDSGAQDGVLYLVTPYVAGESLRARLLRGPLSLPDALQVGTEIAEALDYAHRSGIIHCDVKPENILLADGHAIVADFGVARAVLASGALPDGTLHAHGTVVGSPAYMSPEVMAGADVDALTDIYSFGRVFAEMLTGGLANDNEHVETHVLSRPGLPPDVARLVCDCLATDTARRPASAAEVLRRLARANGAAVPDPARGSLVLQRTLRQWAGRSVDLARRTVAAGRGHGRWLLAGALGGAALAVAALIGIGMATRVEDDPVRFVFTVDSGFTVVDVPGALAISPDARNIAFAASGPDGISRVLVRSSGELRSRLIPGTERAQQLFFSPDGEWIGFYAPPLLKKVRVQRGTPVVIGEVPAMFGADWAPSDEIVVSTAGRLATIPSNSGSLRVLSAPDTSAAELQQLWPIVLADGNTIVYTARGRYVEESRIAIAKLDGGRARILDLSGTGALGVVAGQLVYGVGTGPGRRHDLFAVPFDERRGRVLGAPRAVVEGAPVNWWGKAPAGVSRSGSLVYRFTEDMRRQLIVRQRGGERRLLPGGARPYHDPRFSPDGNRVAVSVDGEGISVFDLTSGTFNRVTAGGQARARYPEWTPDGKRLIYLRCATDPSPCEIRAVPADFSGPETSVMKSVHGSVEVAELVLSRDEQTLVTRVNVTASGRRDIWYRRQVGDTTLKPIVELPGDQFGPRISPDGRWVAFYTNSSPSQVFVTPVPGPGPIHKVSVDAGANPVWAPDGRRLYYLNGTNGTRILSATLQLTPAFSVTARDTVFDGGFDGRPDVHGVFDVAADDRRFVLLERVDAEPRIIVVRDWIHEIRQPPRFARK